MIVDEPQEEILPSKNTIIIGGEAIYAGYGYDPIEDRAYRNAIAPESVFESTDIQPALSVDVKSINERIDIENHLKENYTIVKKSKSFLGIKKKTHTTIREIESYIKVDGQSIAFIVKVKARHQRFFTDGEPILTPIAQRLLDQERYDQFIDNYGHFYVSDRTTGGEVIYTYTYDYCKVDKWNKDLFIKKTESKILGIFGKETTTTVSESDKLHIEQSRSTIRMISSIPGFAPQTVTNTEEANREIQSIQDYLNTNPEKATTIDLKLKPYAELVNASVLEDKLAEKEVCLEEFQNFEEYYDKVTFVAYNGIGFYGRLANEELDEYPTKRMDFDCSDGMPNAAAMFRDRYGNTEYPYNPCSSFTSNFWILLQAADRYPTSSRGPGTITFNPNEWSNWTGDDNVRDPKHIRIRIYPKNNNQSTIIKLENTDYRLALQMSDYDGDRDKRRGTVVYTPWASQGGGWSPWGSDGDDYNFDIVKIMLETRPYEGLSVDDLKLGIQTYDKNRYPYTSSIEYTPWLKQDGGGYSAYAGSNSFDGLDRVRIKLEVENL